MSKESGSSEQAVSEIEAALRSMESLASKPGPKGKTSSPRTKTASSRTKTGRPIRRVVVRWILAIVALSVLPLLVLVRLSVWLYTAYGVWPWIAVLGGAVGAAVVGIVASLMIIRMAKGGFRSPRYLKRVVLSLAIAYCGYSAIYISAVNTKTEQVRATYTSLHPSLRVALSTWMLADSRLVITEGERQVEDYGRMGLPVNEESLHLLTSSGYVHAVDLRTIARSEWRNFLTTIYLKAMGFRTLRHTGTADHLHVSIPVTN